MAYINLPPVEIEIEIPSIVIDETTILRKAKSFSLVYNRNSQEVALAWTVKHYAATATGYGEYLSLFENHETSGTQEAYLAGGCFWGLDHYLSKTPGIIETLDIFGCGLVISDSTFFLVFGIAESSVDISESDLTETFGA